MCLVEVEKTPKLQVGCTLPVAEGMVVHTESDVVKKARKGTLEFLLTNHPLDCPVCDKGGECELQDMVFRYGAGESRFAERKLHVDEQQWSPVVFFDAPRCILCYRCVRACNEGMGVGALGVGESRRDFRDRSQSSRSPGMRRVRRVHRYLPRGRADQRQLIVIRRGPGRWSTSARFARIAPMAARPRWASATTRSSAATIATAAASTANFCASRAATLSISSSIRSACNRR